MALQGPLTARLSGQHLRPGGLLSHHKTQNCWALCPRDTLTPRPPLFCFPPGCSCHSAQRPQGPALLGQRWRRVSGWPPLRRPRGGPLSACPSVTHSWAPLATVTQADVNAVCTCLFGALLSRLGVCAQKQSCWVVP